MDGQEAGKSLLAGRMGAGLTCSANELNQNKGLMDSQKDMYNILNKNSARGSGVMDQKQESSSKKSSQKMSMIESIFSLS